MQIFDNVFFCLPVKYLWGLLTRDDGVGFSLKNNVSVHRLCIRALRARENKRQFYAIILQKQVIIKDIQQNVYPVILLIILSLFVVSCSCLPTLKDFGSGDWWFETSRPRQKYQ